MPQANHRDLELGDITDGHYDQPQSEFPPNGPSHPSLREFNHGDSSWPLYLMYSKMAQEADNKMAERCQKGADGVLVFSGLFLATVATIMSVTIQDLRSDPSGFYLQNIYQVLSNPNEPAPTLAYPPAFSPPQYAIWVNALFLLSGIFSLASALAAILRQEWAHRYIVVTQQPWHTPDEQARIRAIFAPSTYGPDILPGSSGASYFYLPISICCFVFGGLIYVFHITRIGFILLVLLAVIGAINYARITLDAIFKPQKLYYTALTPLALWIYLGLLYILSQVSSHMKSLHGFFNVTRRRYQELSHCYSEGFLVGKQNRAKIIISKKSSNIDAHVLEWTLHCIGEDDALESFLEAIPGFSESKLVNNLQKHLSDDFQATFSHVLTAFLDRTFSSDSISESVRSRRLITCLDAAHSALVSDGVSPILDEIISGRWRGALQSVEIGHSLRRWSDGRFPSQLRRILAHIISRVRERDDHWLGLVRDELEISDHVLKDYVAYGDSVSLAIMIHIARLLAHSDFSSRDLEILRALSNFDFCNTLPELQRDFCASWNEIVQEARKLGAGCAPTLILRKIRHIYIALHHGSVPSPTRYPGLTADDGNTLLEPLSYPLCDIAAHHAGSAESAPIHCTLSTIPFQSQPGQRTEDVLYATQQSIHVPGPSLSPLPIQTAPISIASDNQGRGNVEISVDGSSSNLVPFYSSSDGPSRQVKAEISITTYPSASTSSPFPDQTPALSSNTILTVPSSTPNDIVTPSSYSATLASQPCVPSTTSPDPQVAVPGISGLDPHATSLGMLHAQEDTWELKP